MNIKRINEFPEGSGSLTNDDIFLFMDNPSASGVTKKISLSQIASFVGGGGITLEEAQDNLGNSFLIGGTGIHISYSDNTNSLTINISGLASSNITDFKPQTLFSIWNNLVPLNANLPVLTAGSQSGSGIKTGSFGTSSGTFCQGNDSRLSDARVPLSHNHVSIDISDFNNSVSGLLPVKNILGSGSISISSSNQVFTVSSSGLVQSNINGITGASGVNNIVQMTQANYDALVSKDPNTVYFIV